MKKIIVLFFLWNGLFNYEVNAIGLNSLRAPGHLLERGIVLRVIRGVSSVNRLASPAKHEQNENKDKTSSVALTAFEDVEWPSFQKKSTANALSSFGMAWWGDKLPTRVANWSNRFGNTFLS